MKLRPVEESENGWDLTKKPRILFRSLENHSIYRFERFIVD